MSNVLRLAIVDPKDDTRERLKAMLLGMDIVWLEAECSRYEFFPDVISQSKPDVGVIALDADSTKAISLLERMRTDAPDCAILAVSATSDGHLILRAMRAGAKEFLTLPATLEEMMSALSRIADSKFGGVDGKSRTSKIIAVAGSCGEIGRAHV